MHGPRTIGILGGMGPEATILLQRKVMNAVQANDDCDHIPLLVDMNPRVPSRIAHLIDGTGKDPGPVLADMAVRLQQAGSAALAMPCNTAHHYAGAITQAVDIPFLNMIDRVVDHATRTVGKGGRVGVLASPAVRRIKLFDTALAVAGITVCWSDNEDALLAAIKSLKSVGPTDMARQILHDVSTALALETDVQFVACSEFSLIADSVAPGANGVDTLDLLAQAMVEFATAP